MANALAWKMVEPCPPSPSFVTIKRSLVPGRKAMLVERRLCPSSRPGSSTCPMGLLKFRIDHAPEDGVEGNHSHFESFWPFTGVEFGRGGGRYDWLLKLRVESVWGESAGAGVVLLGMCRCDLVSPQCHPTPLGDLGTGVS